MSADSQLSKEEHAALIKSSMGWRGILVAHVVLLGWIALTAYYGWQ